MSNYPFGIQSFYAMFVAFKKTNLPYW
uniref:Uncharacterized protein n=1 Tax=Anguilla anguilla TaxID=7936 RepID=A0A0E9VKR6_ANGAN